MRHIKFKNISIKNFLSVGDDPVTVDFRPGLHIITGINKDKEDRRNGVGKSTIADAIHFAVFGATLRDLKKEFIINNKNQRGCEVALELEICEEGSVENVKIVRCLGPTKCFLYVDGEDRTRDSIPNTTKAIHSMLLCSPEIFQNCVIMTINNTIPFMGKRKVEKRKFIEGVFNLQVFGEMLLDVRHDINAEKQALEVDAARHEEVEKSLVSLRAQREKLTDDREKRSTKLKSRLQNNIKEMGEIEDSIAGAVEVDSKDITAEIDDHTHRLEQCDEKVKSLGKDIAQHETSLKFKLKERNRVGTDKDTCPVCLRAITGEVLGQIEDRKRKIDSGMSDIEEDIRESTDKLELLTELSDRLKKSISAGSEQLLRQKDVTNNNLRLSQLTAWNAEIDSELNNHTNEFVHLDESIESMSTKANDIKSEISSVNSRMQLLETVKFTVSEEGVKSFIVKKILNLFNNKLAYYLKKMDANCQCTFNEYFEEEIIDEKGKICSYFNFSGAERKNIDLACLFAFMDIRRMQGDVTYNFSVYDELFDSSLDEKGVDLVLGILKERVTKYDECAMVISHRKESIKSATGDIIFLEKENGITRRVAYNEYSA